jgi:transposase-like protein
MLGPHCRSTATTTCKPPTTLGYPRFTYRACGRRFNEWTGTPFNDLQH